MRVPGWTTGSFYGTANEAFPQNPMALCVPESKKRAPVIPQHGFIVVPGDIVYTSGMAQPSIASVSIGDLTFNAIGVHFGMAALHDGMSGMPAMGSLSCAIAVVVNLNDQTNIPFAALNTIFQLAYVVTRDKIQDVVLTFWTDDAKQDVICTYSFRGWISNYVTATGSSRSAQDGDATNHILTLTLQPELDAKQFVNIQLGN